MKHRRRFAELALAVSAVLLVAACGSGPGEPKPPLPTWSPPTWMHGTWMVDTGTSPVGPVTGTVEVSAYNLVAAFQAGGMQQDPLNLAELTEQGASIQLVPGVSDKDVQRYGILITVGASSPVNSFICEQVDSTTMDCSWTRMTPPDTDGTPLATVRLMKQPG